jgi:site-specific DNA-methyltransferase (adenine-specific)
MPTIELLNEDCMAVMARYPDKYFDLACVDPPYGIERFKKGSLRFDKFNQYKDGLKWDIKPNDLFFNELIRVSVNQIIWGANNFVLPPSEYFCVWDKKQTVDNFASAEYAWVSPGLKKPAKVFRFSIHQHNSNAGKIHPTQKPVKLYDWLLHNYAKPGQRILDTHLGSGSSAIAAHYFGVDFVGCELDEDYYNAAKKRFELSTAQRTLFDDV